MSKASLILFTSVTVEIPFPIQTKALIVLPPLYFAELIALYKKVNENEKQTQKPT